MVNKSIVFSVEECVKLFSNMGVNCSLTDR